MKNSIFCNNCGKQGHVFHSCKLPIISNGLIVYRNKKKKVLQKLVKFPDIRCMVAVTATLTNAQRNKPWQVYSNSDTD